VWGPLETMGLFSMSYVYHFVNDGRDVFAYSDYFPFVYKPPKINSADSRSHITFTHEITRRRRIRDIKTDNIILHSLFLDVRNEVMLKQRIGFDVSAIRSSKFG
jgi:hypothetical protein